MRRFLAGLGLAGVLALSGCSLIWPGSSSGESGPSAPASDKYLEEYAERWCYKHLDSRLRENYGAVYTAVKDSFGRDETVSIRDSSEGTAREYSTGLEIQLPEALRSREEAKLIYTAFTWDNPQFFYIGNTYSYKGYRSGGVDYYDRFTLVFTMNAREREQAQNKLERVVDRLVNSRADTGEFASELYFHDQLLEICSYDKNAAASDDPAQLFPNAFSAYGALVEGKAVCEGYSRAMQLLLHEAGMKATLVGGFDDQNVAHMWNMVTIDGRNYHLDATWDDSEDYPRHTFFNLTTEEILRTHRLDGENIGVDTCTAVDANYYRRTGNFLKTAKKSAVADAITRQVTAGGNVVDLRFTPDTYMNAMTFIADQDELISLVNGRLEADGLVMWGYTARFREEYHTVTLYKLE